MKAMTKMRGSSYHCVWQGGEVYAFAGPGDMEARRFATRRGAAWSGGYDEANSCSRCRDFFAPVGGTHPGCASPVLKGGRVASGGIHMSDIPSMPYCRFWQERELVSVANLSRRDGQKFFPLVRAAGRISGTIPRP